MTYERYIGRWSRIYASSWILIGGATVPLWIWKLLAASVPWFFVTLLTYFSSSGSYASTFGGILVLAMPVIILGCLLPTFSSPWVNYILYPVASTAVVVVAVVLYSKRKGATKA